MNKKILMVLFSTCLISNFSYANLSFGVKNDESDQKYKLNIDYEKISPPIKNSNISGTIDVINFFSYGCIPCISTMKNMEEWKLKMPYFSQMNNSPVSPTIEMSYPARIYFTLEKLGRLDLNIPFLEESSNGKTDFSNFNILTSWFEGRGIKPEDFKLAFDSNEVIGKIYSLPSIVKTYQVESIPMITIAGEYKITSKNISEHKEDLKDLVSFLVEKSRNNK